MTEERSTRPIQVSVVLGSYNRLGFLKRTIASVRQELERLGGLSEIIVIDGGSTDGTMRWLTRQKDVVTIIQHNRGAWRGKPIVRRSWGYFMNLGFKAAQGKYVCMLSDDCLVVPGAIRNGVDAFDTRLGAGEKIGAMAFYWRNWPTQKEYVVGITMGHMFVNHGLYLNEALMSVGYIDEDAYHFYNADGDLCLRMLEKGWRCVDSETSFIEHFLHANPTVRKGNTVRYDEDLKTYMARWSHLRSDDSPESIGRWITLNFHDSTFTCREFPRFSSIVLKVRLAVRSLARSVYRYFVRA